MPRINSRCQRLRCSFSDTRYLVFPDPAIRPSLTDHPSQLVLVSKMRISFILSSLLASSVLSLYTTTDTDADTDLDRDFEMDGALNSTDIFPRVATKANMAGFHITTFSGNSCQGKTMFYPDIQYGYNYMATVRTFQINRVLMAGELLEFSAYNGNGNCNNAKYTESVKTNMGPGCYGPVTQAACFRLSRR